MCFKLSKWHETGTGPDNSLAPNRLQKHYKPLLKPIIKHIDESVNSVAGTPFKSYIISTQYKYETVVT